MTGARVGARIAELVADAAAKGRASAARGETAVRSQATKSTMETLERELAPTLRALWTEMLGAEPPAETLAPVLDLLATPTHQADFLVVLLALAGSIFTVPPAAAAGWIEHVKARSFEVIADVPLPFDLVAGMVTRGKLGHGEGAAEARRSGIDGARFNLAVAALKREAPVGEAVAMYRLGHVGASAVAAAVENEGIDPSWAGPYTQSAFRPLPAGTAVAAAVQGHLAQGDLGRFLKADGIDPAYADTWYETAGRPPGPEFMLDLWNRGLVDGGTVRQSIIESDVKVKYTDAILASRYNLPDREGIMAMVRKGTISTERGRQLMVWRGILPDVIDALLATAVTEKHQAAKDLSASQVLSMLGTREISDGQASAMLANLGYDPDEVRLLMTHATTDRRRRAQAAAVNVVRARYTSRRIDRAEASNALDRLEVVPDQRNDLMRLWDVERDASTPQLTKAELATAWKRGIIDDVEYITGLTALGYDDREVYILASITGLGAEGEA